MTAGHIKIEDIEAGLAGLHTALLLLEDFSSAKEYEALGDLHGALSTGLRTIVDTNTWVDFEYVNGFEINKKGLIRTKDAQPLGHFSYRNMTKPEWDYVHWELCDIDGKPHQFKVFTPKGLDPIIVPVIPADGYIPFRNKGL